MALVPYVPSLWRDWFEDFDRPLCLLDNHFRRVLWRDDFFNTVSLPIFGSYWRPWHRLIDHKVTVSSTTTCCPPPVTEPKWCVHVDMKKFCAHEIIVKTIGNSIIIEAKHDELRCDGSTTTTEFMRRYELPKTHDVNGVMCNLSTDGWLKITAPKFPLPRPCCEVIVPIDRVRYPAIKCN